MNLRETTFSATRWIVISAVTRAGVQLLQTAVLARLLVPADFGLMAMAGVVMTVTVLFSDLGLSSALMHQAQPDRRTLSTLYWLNLGAACILALLFAALSWPLAAIYGQPELVAVLGWLALSLPLGALGQQFRVLAEKNLHFKPLAQNEVISTLTGFAVAIATAWLGWGVYAIVASQLLSTAMNSGLAWARLSGQHKPQTSFNWLLAKPFISFGLHRMGDSFWNTALTQADVFIAGLFATPHAVATYAVPRDQSLKIANIVVNPAITRVGLPVMTRLKDDPSALQSVYLKTLRLTASLNFPVYALLALFAEQIVSLLLGNQWQEAATYLRLFAIWGLIRSTGNPSGSLLYAVGMARLAHLWNLTLFLVTIPIIWIATKYGGLPALAWVMLLWQIAIYVLAWRFLIMPACGVSFKTYNAHLAPPLVTTLLASGIAFVIAQTVPEPFILPVGTFVLGCIYFSLSWWLNRDLLTAVLELLAPLRRLVK